MKMAAVIIKNCFRSQGGGVIDLSSRVRNKNSVQKGKFAIPTWDETMPRGKKAERVSRLRGNNRFTD